MESRNNSLIVTAVNEIVSVMNNIVDMLNSYMSEHKHKMIANRKKDINDIATLLFKVSTQKADITKILSKENMSASTPILFPAVRIEVVNPIELPKQLLMLCEELYAVTLQIKPRFSNKTDLKDNMSAALITLKDTVKKGIDVLEKETKRIQDEWHEANKILQDKINKKKEEEDKKQKENRAHNEEVFSGSKVYNPEILERIFSFLDVKKDIPSVSQSATLFANLTIRSENFWKNVIEKNFPDRAGIILQELKELKKLKKLTVPYQEVFKHLEQEERHRPQTYWIASDLGNHYVNEIYFLNDFIKQEYLPSILEPFEKNLFLEALRFNLYSSMKTARNKTRGMTRRGDNLYYVGFNLSLKETTELLQNQNILIDEITKHIVSVQLDDEHYLNSNRYQYAPQAMISVKWVGDKFVERKDSIVLEVMNTPRLG